MIPLCCCCIYLTCSLCNRYLYSTCPGQNSCPTDINQWITRLKTAGPPALSCPSVAEWMRWSKSWLTQSKRFPTLRVSLTPARAAEVLRNDTTTIRHLWNGPDHTASHSCPVRGCVSEDQLPTAAGTSFSPSPDTNPRDQNKKDVKVWATLFLTLWVKSRPSFEIIFQKKKINWPSLPYLLLIHGVLALLVGPVGWWTVK